MKKWLAQYVGNDLEQTELFPLLFRGAGVALVAQFLGAGISYFAQVLLARWMGAADYGTYDYIIAIATLVGYVAGLGFPNSMLRFIPEYTVKQDWGRLKGLILSSWGVVLLSSLLLAIIGSITVAWLSKITSLPSDSIKFGLWSVPLLALVRQQLEMTRASKQIALAYLPSAVFLPLLVIFGSAYYGQELTSKLALIITMVSLAVVIIAQLWCFKVWFEKKCHAIKSIYVPKEWLAVAFPLLLNDGAHMILSQTDILMIGSTLGSFEVGIYTAALKTSAWVGFILVAVNAIAAPMFATLYTQGRLKDLQELVDNIARWLFFPTLLIASALIINADAVLGLFGEEFIAGRWEMIVLIGGQLVNVGAGSVGYILQMTGYHRQCAYVVCCSALLNLILNSILIPMIGILGAAIATAITMALWNIWLHHLVVKNIGVQPSIFSAFKLGR